MEKALKIMLKMGEHWLLRTAAVLKTLQMLRIGHLRKLTGVRVEENDRLCDSTYEIEANDVAVIRKRKNESQSIWYQFSKIISRKVSKKWK